MPKKIIRFGGWALAAFLTTQLVTGAAHAGQDAAKRYFQNGVDLITGSQPNYQDAYYQFQLAYQESSKSWKVLGNLGLCALKLERDQEAVAYYEQYLKKGGNEIAPEERAAIEQDLLLLRGNLAEVHIRSPESELKVVDRRQGSQAPPQSYSLQAGQLVLKLRAGTHTLTATSGDKKLTWEVVLEPKSVTAHTFDFDAAQPEETEPVTAPAAVTPPVGAPPPASPPTRDQSSSANKLRIPGYVALGLGAVGLGAGAYFAWQSSDYNGRAEAAFACNERMPVCTDAERAEVRRLEGESSAAGTRSVVSFAVGGALALTGVVLLVVSGSSSDSAQNDTSPRLLVGYREVGLAGRF
jgi:hypothetical protein